MRRGRRGDGEAGSTSVLVLALLVCAFVLCLGGARLGDAVLARAKAQAAADAAALAAADHLALGHGDAAARRAAQETAHANGAHLVICACSGLVAEVEVAYTLLRTATARARAEVSPD